MAHVVLYVACGALVAYLVADFVVSWYRLRHFPGSFPSAISYLPIISTSRSGRAWEIFIEQNRRYGSLVRIGPNELMTDDPDVVRHMSSARSKYRRSGWYDAMQLNPHDDSMFSIRDTTEHDKLKAKVAWGYAGKETPSLEGDVDCQLTSLVQFIRAKYLSTDLDTKPMDLGRIVQYVTLDTITKIALGEASGWLRSESDVFEYIKSTEEVVPFLQLCSEVPLLCKIFFSNFMLWLIGPKPTDKSGIGKMIGVAQKVVAPRFEPDAKAHKDMLGAFVKGGLTQKECETEVLFAIIAGSDTTATAIRTTFLYLMTTPLSYQALKNEIATGIKDGRISNPITSEEARKMPFLQAVIWEGIRMIPPFAGYLAKEVPPHGDTINGRFVPGGTRVIHNTGGLLRNPLVFGDDADVFRPERFLVADDAKRDTMLRTVELAFGYGRWGCAGKSIALLELNKIFVQVLRHFDLQIMNPMKPWVNINHNLFMQSQMWVRITETKDTS